MNIFLHLEDGGGTGKKRRPPGGTVTCTYCHQLNNLHAHCISCEIPLHTQEFLCHCGKAHTFTHDGIECTSCENYRLYGPSIYPDNFFDGLFAELGF